jgi:hypothetical protein
MKSPSGRHLLARYTYVQKKAFESAIEAHISFFMKLISGGRRLAGLGHKP